MLFGDSELFAVARSAKVGERNLQSGLAELRDWISSEFDVSVVHIVQDYIELGSAEGRPRLNVILETDQDFDSWKTDAMAIRSDIHDKVVGRFKKIASGYPDLESENVHLTIDNFSDECLGRACSAFLKRHAKRITDDFKHAIWQIDGFSRALVVFLYTDDEITRCTANGTCKEISRRCFDAVKQYDEFDYLTDDAFRLRFDSKENLDNNYKSNLFYYWR
ncbi:MAG: hypothetical protein K0U98_05210 [Deltaproteobacteria bacterium]|nr:hypothetical protein [Deltaproteobacteria bacterium]